MNKPSSTVAGHCKADGCGSADVWGVVLAAGTSSRFGDRNKLLQDVDGRPMVHRVAETLLETPLAGIVVVVGYEAADVSAALEGIDAAVCENEAYEDGQSTTVHEGVTYAAEHGADAVLIALGDMPYVSPRTVDALVAAYKDGRGTVIAAAYDGERGNPVLFDRSYFDALTSVTGDIGGRHILRESADAVFLETDDPGVRRDVDTPDDW